MGDGLPTPESSPPELVLRRTRPAAVTSSIATAPSPAHPPKADSATVHNDDRIRLSVRGMFLLAMAFVAFEAFAVCVLTELSRFHPLIAVWLPVDALIGSANDATYNVALWILVAAIPITNIAAWMPGSIVTQQLNHTTSIHHRKTTSSSSPYKHKRPAHRDGYFQIFQLVAWVLYGVFIGCWSLCPPSYTAGATCSLDYRTTMAVLAFIAEILIVSSIVALERHYATTSPRKDRFVVMVNNFNNMLLVVGAVMLAVSAELARERRHDDLDSGVGDGLAFPRVDTAMLSQYSLSSGVNSAALVVTAVFNTYGLGGVLAPKAGWKFFQPFAGGAKFMLFQAVSWTCFAAGLFIQALYLLSVVIVELELFVGAIALAGSLFLISEVLMVVSLLVFKGTSSDTVSSGIQKQGSLQGFHQRLHDFAQECLGAFLAGIFANVQWIPGAMFFVLYAATTSLELPQLIVYSLLTTFVEFLLVISRSIATHLYNQDSQYGKRTHISEYRFKYVFPQLLSMVLPGYFTYTHYAAGHEAALPIAMLSAFFYMYVSSYGGQPQLTGCRERRSWVTGRSEIMETVANYFNGKIFRDAELDPNQHYIMGFHPHGILTTTVQWLQFSQRWRDLFPGIHAHILTASVLHQIPLARDILQFFGGREVTRQAFSRALEQKESVMLVPGGQAEMLEQCSGLKQVRVYTHHKGFIRLAIEHGVPLVPVLSFKEGETMDNVRAPMVQRWFIKKLAFPFPYFPFGRFGLPIPRKIDMAIAVGAPLFVEKHAQPTPAQVDAVHAEYFDRIRGLFDKYKDDAGCGDYTLQLL